MRGSLTDTDRTERGGRGSADLAAVRGGRGSADLVDLRGSAASGDSGRDLTPDLPQVCVSGIALGEEGGRLAQTRGRVLPTSSYISSRMDGHICMQDLYPTPPWRYSVDAFYQEGGGHHGPGSSSSLQVV